MAQAFNPRTRKARGRADLCEFDASLVYVLSSRTARESYTTCLKINKVRHCSGDNSEQGEWRIFRSKWRIWELS